MPQNYDLVKKQLPRSIPHVTPQVALLPTRRVKLVYLVPDNSTERASSV